MASTTLAAEAGAQPASQVHWGAVFAGALCGAGLAVVLDAFGAAIGLAVSSTAPTWRDASIGLAILSGIYLILTAVVSYGFGAFVASRLRGGPAVAAGLKSGAVPSCNTFNAAAL